MSKCKVIQGKHSSVTNTDKINKHFPKTVSIKQKSPCLGDILFIEITSTLNV